MAISEKSRKILWARSGNRCAFCRIELVAEKDENDINLNLGEECHIISSKAKGPRYTPNYHEDYDVYSNLILLCRNHHRMIDEQFETFTKELLHQIKINHENWVKATIDKATKENTNESHKYLKRLSSGKELIDIVNGMYASEFDYDELKTENEVEIIGAFLQYLREMGDLFAMGFIETNEAVKICYNLTKDLKKIEKLGFWVFGDSRKARMTYNKKDDLGIWKIATIHVKRSDNPEIINLEELANQLKND